MDQRRTELKLPRGCLQHPPSHYNQSILTTVICGNPRLHIRYHPRTATINMAETSQNPLLSTSRASDTSPIVQLHPLVLLTITDCISRHTLRQQSGPVIGAILGAQNGQEITMEVAFQAKLNISDEGDVTLDDDWFGKRLEDCKTAYTQVWYRFVIY